MVTVRAPASTGRRKCGVPRPRLTVLTATAAARVTVWVNSWLPTSPEIVSAGIRQACSTAAALSSGSTG